MRYLLSWYIINKHKHDSIKNSSFTLLTRTRLAATFDLVTPSALLRSLIQNSLCSLLRSDLFSFPSMSTLQWKMANSSYHWIPDLWPLWSYDLLRYGWIWAYKWMKGKRLFVCKVVSLWRITGQMTAPPPPLFLLSSILLINNGSGGGNSWLAKNTGLFHKIVQGHKRNIEPTLSRFSLFSKAI